jgi:hypothetical protein
MSIEKLKEQTRHREQKEEWQKALDEYKVAIKKLAEEEQPDIGLYNRVGDLYVRVDNLDAAVEHHEQSVDLYMETFLPNNVIAVEAKIRELDPSADVGGAPAMLGAEGDDGGLADSDDVMGHFSDIATEGSEDQETDDGAADLDLGGFDIDTDGDTEQRGGDLDVFGSGSDDDADAEESGEAAAFDIGGGDDVSELDGEPPTFDIGGADDEEAGGELLMFDADDADDEEAGSGCSPRQIPA